MSEVKHTPTPWYIHDDSSDIMSDWGIIRAKSDDLIVAQTCNLGRYTEDEANAAHSINFGPKEQRGARIAQPPTVIANAEFICRAVNAHDELVAALKACEALVSEGFVPNWDWVRSVIAKAEGDAS